MHVYFNMGFGIISALTNINIRSHIKPQVNTQTLIYTLHGNKYGNSFGKLQLYYVIIRSIFIIIYLFSWLIYVVEEICVNLTRNPHYEGSG